MDNLNDFLNDLKSILKQENVTPAGKELLIGKLFARVKLDNVLVSKEYLRIYAQPTIIDYPSLIATSDRSINESQIEFLKTFKLDFDSEIKTYGEKTEE